MDRLRMQDRSLWERPYEKMELHGAAALSPAELLAVILCSGDRKHSALDLAQQLLKEGRKISDLHGLSQQELMHYPGIGRVKALRLQALSELCVRSRQDESFPLKRPVRNPDEAFALLRALADEPKEHFHLLLLDCRKRLIRRVLISSGALDSVSIKPRELFREALKANAASLIMAHNHPSGDPEPSEADIQMTRRVCKMGREIGISIDDHLIVTKDRYVSLKEQGVI